MKVQCRRTSSRASVSTTTTTTTMITTCAADWGESLLRDMKEYVPDLIPETEVLNLLLRCYRDLSGPPRPGEVGGGGADEDKSVRYPERSLSLIRDMESIRDQAEAEETAAAVDDEGEDDEDDDNWDGKVGNNIQE